MPWAPFEKNILENSPSQPLTKSSLAKEHVRVVVGLRGRRPHGRRSFPMPHGSARRASLRPTVLESLDVNQQESFGIPASESDSATSS